MYFYDKACSLAKKLLPSNRGELEITDLNIMYMKRKVKFLLDRGDVWLDAGTHITLSAFSNMFKQLKEDKGMKISCPEEVTYRSNLIDKNKLKLLAKRYSNNDYE